MEKENIINILLVDDHAAVIEGTRRFIEQLPLRTSVRAALSGREASRLIAPAAYDLYILDIELDDDAIDGFTLVRQINAIISKKIKKALNKLPTESYRLIMKHLLSLEQNPRPFGYCKLSGSDNKYRIRIGDYRVIYSIKDDILTVEVVEIDHRSSIYRG
ncbi:Response regulator of citrate/malate metabolism [Bacteroidales bacterium Barb6]|nr:Response regulator of citrate/malate metabolism [Bacteroidales bacterium Barb6]